jgi:hypothetical protein
MDSKMNEKEIIDYQIVQSDNIGDCEDRVRQYMKSGWSPIGGISIAVHENRNKLICQSIVKYKK